MQRADERRHIGGMKFLMAEPRHIRERAVLAQRTQYHHAHHVHQDIDFVKHLKFFKPRDFCYFQALLIVCSNCKYFC